MIEHKNEYLLTRRNGSGLRAGKIMIEWTCPRCGYQNSYENEVCMGAEMGDGRCGYPKVMVDKVILSTDMGEEE